MSIAPFTHWQAEIQSTAPYVILPGKQVTSTFHVANHVNKGLYKNILINGTMFYSIGVQQLLP